MYGISSVCVDGSAKVTELIYLKGEEVAGNNFYLYILSCLMLFSCWYFHTIISLFVFIWMNFALLIFLYLNYPTYNCTDVTHSIMSYVMSFTHCNSMSVIKHLSDLAYGMFVSWTISIVSYFCVMVVIVKFYWCPWKNCIYRIGCLTSMILNVGEVYSWVVF